MTEFSSSNYADNFTSDAPGTASFLQTWWVPGACGGSFGASSKVLIQEFNEAQIFVDKREGFIKVPLS